MSIDESNYFSANFYRIKIKMAFLLFDYCV